jgi:hypothetical protein
VLCALTRIRARLDKGGGRSRGCGAIEDGLIPLVAMSASEPVELVMSDMGAGGSDGCTVLCACTVHSNSTPLAMTVSNSGVCHVNSGTGATLWNATSDSSDHSRSLWK